jgi:hypothetical protein
MTGARVLGTAASSDLRSEVGPTWSSAALCAEREQ